MTMRPTVLAAAILAIGVVVACSKSSGSNCSTEACGGPSPLSYQACGTSADLTTYDYGGQSCTCTSADAAACGDCKTGVIRWCEGLGDASVDSGVSRSGTSI